MINTNATKVMIFNKYARVGTFAVIVVYMLASAAYSFQLVGLHNAVMRIIAGVAMVVMIFWINHSNHVNAKIASWLTPTLLLLIETVLSLYLGSNGYYFFFLVACSAISLNYLDRIGFVIFTLVVNVIVIGQLFIGVRILGEGFSLTYHWMLFLGYDMLNILLYTVCVYAVSRMNILQRTSRTFDTIIETTPNHMIITNEKARVEQMSQTLAKWLGIHNKEYTKNLPLLDIFTNFEMKMIFHRIIESEGYIEMTFDVIINNKQHWFMLRSMPIYEKKLSRFIEWSDVTPIMEAKNAAEASDMAKSDFLAKMSHEIRTPMNAIMGMSELILREELSSRVRENAVGIKNASTNLLSIINDILDFSKIESGKLEIIEEEYLLSSLINDAVSIIRMRLRDSPVLFVTYVDCDLPNMLYGDEVRFRQILFNLLSNAVKYTKEGSFSLTVDGERRGDTLMFSITVEDSGIGIKSEDIGRLFGEFSQIDIVKNRGIEGTGLGLAITRNLCRAMGGDVTVESVYGAGSKFKVVLPQKIRGDAKFASIQDDQRKPVLIYETRRAFVCSLVRSFDNLGIPCKTVDCISDLHDELQKIEYSYVFVSSYMYETASSIMERLETDTKLVLLTRYGEIVSAHNVRSLAMPAHALTIANVLGDISEDYTYSESPGIGFIAPSAKILIVDDITTNLKVAEGLMLPYKMQIDTSSNGYDAIEKVKNKQYDIIFMDHMMPEIDGIETTIEIRNLEDSYFKDVPIIALTANAVTGVREMFIQNGMNDFLAKPIEIPKLNSMLEKWIPKSKKEKHVIENHAQELPDFELQGVDVASGIALTGGNVLNYKKTLAIYKNDGITKLKEIKECFLNQDIQLFTTHVHAIKSASASIGAADVSLMAAALEAAGKKNDDAFIAQNLDMFLTMLSDIVDNITKVLDTGKSDESVDDTTNISELSEKFELLKEALDNMDIGTIDSIMDELQAKEWGSSASKQLEQISQSILLFEYDEALKNIDDLLRA